MPNLRYRSVRNAVAMSISHAGSASSMDCRGSPTPIPRSGKRKTKQEPLGVMSRTIRHSDLRAESILFDARRRSLFLADVARRRRLTMLIRYSSGIEASGLYCPPEGFPGHRRRRRRARPCPQRGLSNRRRIARRRPQKLPPRRQPSSTNILRSPTEDHDRRRRFESHR
jgi:hypothetical protein